ncbi:MAG: hypothetical protein OHK0047_38260 [Leptolyngbyaceae cyanobacterium]|uniref:hypothetical protein n=1 Tax=Leptodesmis sichuanensis TaxID=2906798 RepID=UPI001F2C804D|nr:hypothetical protein [Leptodesmis sichuanensis]UIE38132.1 hypothetical protein KIK02_00245 [Leptodesmis sichuanensis A121]
MKHYLLAIALIVGLLFTDREAGAIAAPPLNPKTGIKQPVQFSEPNVSNGPGIEHALLLLTFLGLPAGKLLHRCRCTYRAKVLQQQVDALEKVWQIESYSSPEQ